MPSLLQQGPGDEPVGSGGRLQASLLVELFISVSGWVDVGGAGGGPALAGVSVTVVEGLT